MSTNNPEPMHLKDRVKNYKAIELRRQRPLIVYATSTRQGLSSVIAGDAVRELIEQIDAISAEQYEVDVLIHSAGGDALAAWKLMSVLRERFRFVGVLVPFTAFSAATLFCLGADEIVMHPHASLGPIDPQIEVPRPGETTGTIRFSFEDVGAFLRFLKDEIGLSEQAYVTPVIEKLLSVVDPVRVGGAKRASELSTDVGERLLRMHMTSPDDRGRTREIADRLNKSFFAHGDAVSRSRARELQLKVAADDEKLEKLMWEAYLGLESYMDLRSAFNLLEYYLAHDGKLPSPPGPLVLPPNTPDQVAQQIWSAVAQEALQDRATPVQVDYQLVHAVIESGRKAAEYRSCGTLSAVGMTGGEVRVGQVVTSSRWVSVEENLPTG